MLLTKTNKLSAHKDHREGNGSCEWYISIGILQKFCMLCKPPDSPLANM